MHGGGRPTRGGDVSPKTRRREIPTREGTVRGGGEERFHRYVRGLTSTGVYGAGGTSRTTGGFDGEVGDGADVRARFADASPRTTRVLDEIAAGPQAQLAVGRSRRDDTDGFTTARLVLKHGERGDVAEMTAQTNVAAGFAVQSQDAHDAVFSRARGGVGELERC